MRRGGGAFEEEQGDSMPALHSLADSSVNEQTLQVMWCACRCPAGTPNMRRAAAQRIWPPMRAID